MQRTDATAWLARPGAWRVVATGLMPPEKGQIPAARQAWYRSHQSSHSQAELLLVLRGRTVYGLGDRLVPVGPGTFMFFAPMEVHQSGYPPFESDTEHAWISLLPGQFTARVLRLRGGRISSDPIGPGVFDWADAGLLPQAFLKPVQGLPAAILELRVRLLCNAVALAILNQSIQSPSENDPDITRARLIRSIQEHLEQTAGRGDKLDSLARIAGYSTFHFHRVFKQETGRTVHSYIESCRRRRVRELLDRQISKKAIAAELGFATPQSFSRWLGKGPLRES